MKNLFIKFLLLCFANILFLQNTLAQDCSSPSGQIVTYPTTINGIGITLATSGDVQYAGVIESGACNVSTPIGLPFGGHNNGAFSLTFTFTQTVNDISILIYGSCPGESFTFATNAGTPTIALGGTCPTSYSLSGTTVTANALYISSFVSVHTANGYNSITVTGNGGQAGSYLTICRNSVAPPCNLAASASAGIIACNGGTTTVTVSATGGTPPFTGTGTFTVGAGPYSYTVTDSKGCTSTASGTITQPDAITVTPTIGTILCFGGATTIVVSATGGTPPYAGTGTFTIRAGPYTSVVTDSKGCTSTASGTITQPAILSASSTAGTIICNGGTTTVTVNATGGTPPFSGTGAFTVGAGAYSYTVTDANGCKSTTTGNITQPAAAVGGTVAPAQKSSCGPTTVNLSVSGITGTVKQWERQANCTGNWVSIGFAGMTAITVTTPNQTTCYRANVTNGACPTSAFSTVSTITVDKPAVGGKVTLLNNQTATSIALCAGENALLIPKNYVGKVANWQYTFGTSSIWYDLPLTENSPTLTVNGSTVKGTLFYRVVIVTELGLCTGLASVAYSTAFRVNKKAGCLSPDGSVVNNDIQTNLHLSIQKVYPNPASHLVTLEIENVTASGAWQEGVTQLEILDITGRQVLKQTLNLTEGFNTISLDVSKLSRGVFIVKLTDGQNQKAWVKMVKE